MTPFVAQVTHFFSAGVVALDILIVVACVALLSRAFRQSNLFKAVSDKAIIFAFIISLGATLGSFFYSSIAGFPPCDFCWYQRMFLFPQVILFAVALIKKDDRVIDYSIALSAIGALIAIYHYYGQMFNPSALPCAAEAVSCAKREFVEFGYITIPIMSLTTFLILILLMAYRKINRPQVPRI